jgi:hypothetical protein
MNLLFRFLRFLVSSVLHLLFHLLLGLLAVVFRLLLLPLLVLVLRVFRDLIFLSFTATVNGPTRFIDRLAGEWTHRVFDLVDDREHVQEVYQLCRLMVGGLIVLGWIITGLFTVEILRIVFGFFI